MNIRDLKCLLALNRTVLHLSWLRQCRRRTVRLLAWLSPTVSDFVRSLGKYENILTTIISKQSSIKGRGCLNREIPFKTTSKVQNFVAYVILKKKMICWQLQQIIFSIIHSVFWNERGQRSFTTLLWTHLVKCLQMIEIEKYGCQFWLLPETVIHIYSMLHWQRATFPFQNNQW